MLTRKFLTLHPFTLLSFILLFTCALSFFTPRPLFAASPNGFSKIDAIAGGVVDVHGVANHEGFRKWQLDLLINGDPNQAIFLAVSEQPLSEPSPLTKFNTAQYPDGEHKLRLRVVYTGLQYDEYFTPIIIANQSTPANQSAETATQSQTGNKPLQVLPQPGSPPLGEQNPSLLGGTLPIDPAKLPDPTNYRQTLEVGSGYTVTYPVSRNDRRAQIESAQSYDGVRMKRDVPEGTRWIEVDLSEQKLTAYQGDVPVLVTQVSTGKKNGTEEKMHYTETITGRFRVQKTYESVRMIGPGYDTPNVPWALFFFRGFAIHGAYWHNEFGMPVSHGCVNMRVEEAKEIYDWAAVGTEIIVHE